MAFLSFSSFRFCFFFKFFISGVSFCEQHNQQYNQQTNTKDIVGPYLTTKFAANLIDRIDDLLQLENSKGGQYLHECESNEVKAAVALGPRVSFFYSPFYPAFLFRTFCVVLVSVGF